MEAVIILIIAFFVTRKKISESFKEVEELPIGNNSDGYFDDSAFTLILNTRKENRQR